MNGTEAYLLGLSIIAGGLLIISLVWLALVLRQHRRLRRDPTYFEWPQ